jgi:hypothetical protein
MPIKIALCLVISLFCAADGLAADFDGNGVADVETEAEGIGPPHSAQPRVTDLRASRTRFFSSPIWIEGKPPVKVITKKDAQYGAWCERSLFLAVKGPGNFAQLFVLILPAGFECPGEDLLKMITVIHDSMNKNNVGAVFCPA